MLKRWTALLMLLVFLMPLTALALTSSSTTSYNRDPGSDPRSYRIKFDDEDAVGTNDKWPVYSAPDFNAVRGGNGKAMVHTGNGVRSSGWYGAWLMICYTKNDGGIRVGWVPKSEFKHGKIRRTRSVNFAYWDVTVNRQCGLTDDPLYETEMLAYASAGEKLTYLGYYQYRSGREYAYVQGDIDGYPVCGFIPFDAIAW